MFLVSNGGQFYIPEQPGEVAISCATGRWEIIDAPFAEYYQRRFVCRETAEYLSNKYPDMFCIRTD